MRLGLFAAALAMFALAGISTAGARPYYEETGYGVESWGTSARGAERQRYSNRGDRRANRYGASRRYASRTSYSSGGRYSAGPRPGRWCGWWMRTQLGGGPEFNLARNWRKWGRPAGGPMVGAVVVWNSHVGMITGRAANGKWIVKSGNDGGRVRERARSVAGASFRIG
jgi:hypothetical protein